MIPNAQLKKIADISNPEGIAMYQPRVDREAGYPGLGQSIFSTLKGLNHHAKNIFGRIYPTLSGLKRFVLTLPRVARFAGQPWADTSNPFGIVSPLTMVSPLPLRGWADTSNPFGIAPYVVSYKWGLQRSPIT